MATSSYMVTKLYESWRKEQEFGKNQELYDFLFRALFISKISHCFILYVIK